MSKLRRSSSRAIVLLATIGQVNAEVLINEVAGNSAGTDNEYIELFKSGSQGAVDTSGWTITLYDSDAGNADRTLSNNSIDNSSDTMVLRDSNDDLVNITFVTDGDTNEVATIAGDLIPANYL